MNGVLAIEQERLEQVEKHGYDLVKDNELNVSSDLESAAAFVLTGDEKYYPEHWEPWFKENIQHKDFKERMAIAGALCAAAYDLRKYVEENTATN